MNKSFQTGVALVVFLWASHFVCGQQLRDSFRRVKNSVVVVHSSNPKPTDSSRPGEVEDSGLGSGVLISSDGKILTAAPVVDGEDRLLVLALEEDVVAGATRERGRGIERRLDRDVVHLRGEDLLEVIDGHSRRG